MKSKKTISLAATDVAEMIKDLGVIVVSLDRIGSTDFQDQKQCAVALDAFFDATVFRRLARTRGILSEAYNSQSTKAAVMRLEKQAERLPYWKSKQP